MITFDKENRTITLHTQASTYQMKIDSTGVLLHTYYGPYIRGGDHSRRIGREDRGFSQSQRGGTGPDLFTGYPAPGVLLQRRGRLPQSFH